MRTIVRVTRSGKVLIHCARMCWNVALLREERCRNWAEPGSLYCKKHQNKAKEKETLCKKYSLS